MKLIDFSVKNRISGYCSQACWLVLAGLFCLLPWTLHAVEVTGLYQGAVTVSSRGSESERNRGFSQAFRQVLLKVTGDEAVLSQPAVRQALANADDYVDTWSYRNMPAPINPAAEGALAPATIELNVTFFEPDVRRLLELARIPIWPGNRPYTLVWVALQDELGQRQLIGSSSAGYANIAAMFEQHAGVRALPILFPVLDIEDRRAISATDVWDMERDSILAASTRYQSESVLVVRMFRTLSGDVLGESQYFLRGQVFTLEAFEMPVAEFVRKSLDMVANELSAYYAVFLSGTESNVAVNMTIAGISSAEAYAGLLNYVGQLTDVNNYQVAQVKGDTIRLTLSTGGQLRQLVETIALSQNLLPTGELVRNENEVFMSYQWNGQ